MKLFWASLVPGGAFGFVIAARITLNINNFWVDNLKTYWLCFRPFLWCICILWRFLGCWRGARVLLLLRRTWWWRFSGASSGKRKINNLKNIPKYFRILKPSNSALILVLLSLNFHQFSYSSPRYSLFSSLFNISLENRFLKYLNIP